jgi:transcriptional regulator with XRE-family HTH domain
MKLSAELTDAAILQEMGRRFGRARLASGLTQAQAAEEAGIAKRTLERLEAGKAVDSVTLIRVLRALNMSANLDSLLPDLRQNPVALLRSKGRPRSRVKHPQTAKRDSATQEAGPWKWGE